MGNRTPRVKFPGGLFVFLPHMFLCKVEKVKFYFGNSAEWFILVDRLQETEKNDIFPTSVGYTCQLQEIQYIQI